MESFQAGPLSAVAAWSKIFGDCCRDNRAVKVVLANAVRIIIGRVRDALLWAARPGLVFVALGLVSLPILREPSAAVRNAWPGLLRGRIRGKGPGGQRFGAASTGERSRLC